MTYDWETMQAFEKLKTEHATTPTPKPKKRNCKTCNCNNGYGKPNWDSFACYHCVEEET